MKRGQLLTLVFIAFGLCSCLSVSPFDATDPLPYPAEYTARKDLSVDPGDSFFDYCNGTWLKNHPIPAPDKMIGGYYEADPAMEERVETLKKTVPDIGRFFELLDAIHTNPEASQAYIDAQKAKIPRPQSKEEAFLTLGRLIADGVDPWGAPIMPAFTVTWDKDHLVATLNPPIELPDLPMPNPPAPATLVPIVQTKAGGSAPELIARGIGMDPSEVYMNPSLQLFWSSFENKTLEQLCQIIDGAWDRYGVYVSPEKMGKTSLSSVRSNARASLGYTISYHLAKQFLTEAFKEKYLGFTREIQASLSHRIEKVDWLSQTTKANALEKLAHCGLYVAYPDQWYEDCVSSYANCETLVEAVHRNNRNIVLLTKNLAGTDDVFSHQLSSVIYDSNAEYVASDLTLCNAMYIPLFNCVVIYPALMMPPAAPDEGMSEACFYAAFVMIGHEFTHGFDSQGSKYDKYGNEQDWWTVADRMAFEDRTQNLINCYSHLEMEPGVVGRSGIYGDGARTLTENIADLGGFLTVLDAYQARLREQGFGGEELKNQLRKFYESYAHIWSVQYGDNKFSILQKSDVHSHARLRVNGVVMNTDLWYDLYDVDRNNLLYLPPERRTKIW